MTSKKTQKIFISVSEKVQALIKPDRFYIALYDQRKARLEFPWVGENGKSASLWETRDVDKSKLTDYVILENSLLHYGQDVANQLERQNLTYWPEGEIPASWLGVPVIFEGKKLGAMIAESFTPGAFDQRAASLLTTIAGQTATAIERVRLGEQLDRRIRNLDAVYKFGQKINSAIDLEEPGILKLIYEQLDPLMNTENMYIALYDHATDTVSFPLMYIEGEKTEVASRKAGSGRTEYILKTQKPIFIETRKASIAWYEQEGKKEYLGDPLASWIGVPMISGNKTIGVIATYHKTEDHVYDQENLWVLNAIANQAAIALENARLLEKEKQQQKQLEKRNEQLKALQDISINITSQLDLNKVLGSIAEIANNLMSADFTTLFFYDSDAEEFSVGTRIGAKEAPSIPTEDSYVYKIAKSGYPIFYDGLSTKREYPTVKVDDRDCIAFVGLPLPYGDHIVGVLLINYFQPHRFSPSEMDTIKLFSSQAAVALENARLNDTLENKVKERTKQLTILQDIGVQIKARHDLKDVLGAIADGANVILSADFSTLFTYNANHDKFEIGVRKGTEKIQPSIPSNTGLSAYITKSEGVFVDNAREYEWKDKGFLRRKNVSSFAGIPLKMGNHTVVGVLFVNFHSSHTFAEEEKGYIQHLANQAAVAIENAQLYQELKQALEELKRTQDQRLWAEIGQTAGSLAHRIGNKGGIIRVAIKDLYDEMESIGIDNPIIINKLRMIDRNNQYLLEMSDLLFKPVEASKIDLNKTDIILLVKDAVYSVDIPDDVKIIVEDNVAQLPQVPVNRSFVDVFVEIINNALVAMQSSIEKVITITGRISGNVVEIDFHDTGRGISIEEQETIFDLFDRLPDSNDNYGKHRGFGLWWAKSFLSSLGGDVQCKSLVGGGSNFIVQIPL